MIESDIAARYSLGDEELAALAPKALNQCCEPLCDLAWLILEVRRMRVLVENLAARCAGQSELLTAKAMANPSAATTPRAPATPERPG